MLSLRAAATAVAVATVALTVPASPASASGCHYKVVWSVAGVYEKPTNASTLLKDKYAGDIVGEYCNWTYYNSTEGNTYLAVATATAEDGVGWMRAGALVQVS